MTENLVAEWKVSPVIKRTSISYGGVDYICEEDGDIRRLYVLIDPTKK